MKNIRQAEMNFLKALERQNLEKEEIFEALFSVCGTGSEVNTNHVFFQDVIIRFNAQKAKKLITQGISIVNESHFVDVALGAYIDSGFSMKNFNNDLELYRKKLRIYNPVIHKINKEEAVYV